jgi:hypothetical protein
LAILLKPFGVPAPKDFTIIWHSNILYLSVPDEGFSRILSCISVVIKHKLYLMSFHKKRLTSNPTNQDF